ncbi:MAG: hypothetical protein LUO95_04455, partial [Methylococcaceae bacterium]|nr:hypothetical protein [Methylococcaceae bacterium]
AVSSMLRNYTGDCPTITTSNTLCDATPNTNQFPGPTTPLTGTSSCSTNGNNPWTALCQNGSKKGRAYERNGSDYLDDVAVGLYDMDLRPTWTGMTWAGSSKPKNNLKTYAIGIADPALQADSVLRDAAQRTGGTFEYADNANKLIDALNKMVADIKKGTGSFSAITANSSSLGVGTALFQAKYDTTDWTGDLLALPLTNGGIVLNAAWNAGENIPAFLSRNIYTYNSSATIKGVKFQSQTAIQICTGLSATQKTALGISSCASTDTGVWLLDYVRGDISHEVVNPSHQLTYTTDPRLTATNRIFRNRARFYGSDAIAPKKEGDLRNPDPWLLGDIINSDVLFVGNTENFDYANLAGTKSLEGTTYDAFVTEKSKRRKMVYVGANDGMLHGFDARIPPTGTTDPEAGKEILAYIPNTVIDRLDSLSNPSYSHLYFVDGSPQANDVYLPNVAPVVPSNNWHTVLVGTTGAGGKGVFALDVTDPGTFGASNVLWEVSNTDGPISGDVTMDNPNPPIANKGRGFAKNLGYTLPQAAMGKMHNGDWAAIVANGYSSDNNLGVLYILNIQTGAIIAAIDTKQISAGLSAPLIVDIDGDGIVDSIYAGDLVGNMWKFDVSDSDPKKWKIAYGTNAAPAPLFIACTDATSTATCDATRQPITASPQESSVGSAQATGGSMVYFGTGKYFEDSDNNVANTQTQSFYAVWDECPLANSSTPAPTATCSTVAKTALVKQSIIAQLAPSATVPFNVRATSNTAVNYPTQKGWYIDFVNPNTNANEGERIVSASLLQNGDIIFATLVPSPPTTNNADPNALCNAGTKSTSWVMEFDALSGSRLTSPVLDINNDGKFDSGDQVTVTVGGVEISVPVSGFQTIGSTRTPVILTDAAATSTTGGGSTTGGTTTGGTTGGGTTSGGTTTGGTTTDGNSGSDGGVTGVTAKSSSGTECINGDEASCIKRQDLPPSDKGASRQSWRQL